MNGYGFAFAGATLTALPSGALHWSARGLLVVSDLHLGKSERMARRGGALLPPYETRATLARLEADLVATGARSVLCLGDSFDDAAACDGLDAEDCDRIRALVAGRGWLWIDGNHDEGIAARAHGLGGTHAAEVALDGIAFRHIATDAVPEVSGHWHPKAALAGRARPCFLIDARRIVLPAYGAYTGGLFAHDPALAGLMGPGAIAVLTGTKALPCPLGEVRVRGRG